MSKRLDDIRATLEQYGGITASDAYRLLAVAEAAEALLAESNLRETRFTGDSQWSQCVLCGGEKHHTDGCQAEQLRTALAALDSEGAQDEL